jgi:hypothetical protein
MVAGAIFGNEMITLVVVVQGKVSSIPSPYFDTAASQIFISSACIIRQK